MQDRQRIIQDPGVAVGRSCLRGTQVTVGTILRLFADGYSEDKILKACPDLEREDIREALSYAAELLEEPEALCPQKLSEYFRQSPLVGIDLEIERDRGRVNDAPVRRAIEISGVQGGPRNPPRSNVLRLLYR